MSVSPIATTRSSSSSASRSCGPWKIWMRSGRRLPKSQLRSVNGVPEYRPSSVSGGRMPISRSSSRDGSSSTTIAMFFIASRNVRGIDASASATRLSNFSRCICFLIRRPLPPGSFIPGLLPAGGNHRCVVVALIPDDADVAVRLRLADAAAVENQGVRGPRPAIFLHRGAELLLDFDRVVALGDADAVADAQDVAIDRQARHAERVSEDDVGGLAADAGKLRQRVHVGRHLAAVIVDQRLRHADQRLRLLAEEPCRVDRFLEVRRLRLGERPRIRISLEERRRDHVDARIGRLGRQHRGDEELVGVLVLQLGVGVRMLRLEQVEDVPCPGRSLQCVLLSLFQPTLVYESENTRQCSCSAAMRFGTNCTGTTTFIFTGARTTCWASASLISLSESGITSQKVSVKSKGVCAMEQKFAYVRGVFGESSGTIVKLICLG